MVVLGSAGAPKGIELYQNLMSIWDPFGVRLGGPTWAPNRLEIGLQNGPEGVDNMTSSGDGLQVAPRTEIEPL